MRTRVVGEQAQVARADDRQLRSEPGTRQRDRIGVEERLQALFARFVADLRDATREPRRELALLVGPGPEPRAVALALAADQLDGTGCQHLRGLGEETAEEAARRLGREDDRPRLRVEVPAVLSQEVVERVLVLEHAEDMVLKL